MTAGVRSLSTSRTRFATAGLAPVLLWTVFRRASFESLPTFAIFAAFRLLFGARIDAQAALWSHCLASRFAFDVLLFVHMSRGGIVVSERLARFFR